jgi:biopolymer transport protein ExbD
VKIDLPKAANEVNITKPEHIKFGIREDSSPLWNGEAATLDQLPPRFAAAEAKQPPPEPHIRADRHAHCEKVAQLGPRCQGQPCAHRLRQRPGEPMSKNLGRRKG